MGVSYWLESRRYESLSQCLVLPDPLQHEAFTKLREVIAGQVEGLCHARGEVGARCLVRLAAEHPGEMSVINTGGPREGTEDSSPARPRGPEPPP